MASPIDEPSTPTPDRRWLGYRPRTVVIIGALLGIVVLLEAQWLWSPLRSGPSGSAAVAPATTDSTDPSADPSAGDVPDPDPVPVADVPFHVRARVTIRSGPSAASAPLGHVATGATVSVTCVTSGEAIATSAGPDPKWDHVTVGTVSGYLTDSLVTAAPDAPVDDLGAC